MNQHLSQTDNSALRKLAADDKKLWCDLLGIFLRIIREQTAKLRSSANTGDKAGAATAVTKISHALSMAGYHDLASEIEKLDFTGENWHISMNQLQGELCELIFAVNKEYKLLKRNLV